VLIMEHVQVSFSASGADLYEWSPTDGLSNSR